MLFSQMTDKEVLVEIGSRIRQKRLNKNITHKELVEQTGMSRTTISKIENGESASFSNIIMILRALDSIDQLDLFLPATLIDPATLSKIEGDKRQRASKKKEVSDTSWEWGE